MVEFNIIERTEPFTIEEVFDFIDDTNIGKMDSCELKSRIVDVIQAERNKAIDEFVERLKKHLNQFDFWKFNCVVNSKGVEIRSYDYMIDEIAEQMKGGAGND